MSKRDIILKTAAHLFATQGFDTTTTLQITREAGVSEPMIFYHFKGKNELFTQIIAATFSEYFSRIDDLEKNSNSPFGQIRKLIELQYGIAKDMPDEVQLIASACPARLNDPQDICASNVKEYRRRLLGYLTRSLSDGIKCGDFRSVPVEETAILILSLLNGIVRYSRPVEFPHKGTHREWNSTGGLMSKDPEINLCKAAVDFCRRSLVNFSKAET